jgi:predicted RNase H-like HicB family nuclease
VKSLFGISGKRIRRFLAEIMSEIIFIVENSDEGGYTAKSLGYSIYTEGETLDELKENIKDAIKCHFDAKEVPHIVRLHIVKDEVIAI